MIHPVNEDAARYALRMRWFLAGAWIVILAKCTFVWWAMNHWNVPIHPGWVVIPTLMLAGLATVLWAAPHED